MCPDPGAAALDSPNIHLLDGEPGWFEEIHPKPHYENGSAEPGDDPLHLRATMRISPVISTRLAVVLLIAAALFVRSAGISAAAPVAAPADRKSVV